MSMSEKTSLTSQSVSIQIMLISFNYEYWHYICTLNIHLTILLLV